MTDFDSWRDSYDAWKLAAPPLDDEAEAECRWCGERSDGAYCSDLCAREDREAARKREDLDSPEADEPEGVPF